MLLDLCGIKATVGDSFRNFLLPRFLGRLEAKFVGYDTWHDIEYL